MASARSDHSPRPSSSAPSSTQSPIPQPPAVLSNEDIEAVIKMATSTRPNAEGRPLPNRDTRTQLFIGNLPYRVRWQDLKDLFRKAGTVLRADVSLGPDNRSRGYGTVLLATAEDAGRAVDMFNGYSWQTRTLEVRLDRLPPELDYSTASNLNVVGMPSSSSMPTMPVMRNLGGVSGGLNNVFSAPSPLHGMPYIPPAPQAQPAPGPSSMLSLPPTAPSLNETFDTLYQGLGTYAPEPLHATAAKVPLRIVFVGNLPFHCQWQDLKDLFRQAGTVVRADVALGSDGRSRGFGTVMFATEADAERAVKNFNGFEYNGRALKVHFDKFAQMPQPSLLSTTMSASSSGSPQQPNAFSSQQQQNNMSGGYMPLALGQSLSLGAQYNYNQQQQRSPTLSTFEAYSFNQPTFAPSPRLSERHIASSHPSSSSNNTSRSNDNDNSNNAPTATTSSVVPHPPHPPLPLPLQGSSASTGVAGPAQEGNSNSPSSQRSHSHSHSGQNHPAHPGPISLPPPGSFVPMPHLSPSGLSPMHHPMSPLHMPGHPHVVAMTPHGLPPITPSMPPFSFLPQDSPQFQHHQHHQHQHQHPHPHHPQHPHQHQQGQGQHNTSSSTHPHSPTAGTPMMHPAHRMFAPFSPGMTMSPGAFWGRPGPGGHAGNPYLNPAVGSPVLMHAPPLSPGGMYGGHPGTPGMMGEEPTGYFPPIPSPHHLQQQQQQPSGYFPPVPVQMNAEPVPAPVPAQAQGHGQGHVAEALEKEIMRDTNNGSAASSTVDTTGSGLTDTGSSVAETTATRSSLATSWVSDEHVGVGISPAGKVVPGSVSTGDISSILSLSSEETGGSGTQQQHDQQQQSIQPPPRSQAMSAGANIPPHAPPALTHKTHSDQTGVHLRTRSATPSSSSTKPGWSSGWDGRADSHNNSSNNSHNHTTSSVSASATGSASAASTSTNPRPRLEYDWDIWGLNAPPGSSRLPPELDLDLDVAERLRRCRDRDWERSAAAHAHAAAAAGATSGDGSAPSGTPSTGTGAGATAPTATATLTDAFSEFRLDPDPISAAARRARWGLDLAGQQFQSQSSRGRQGESRTVSGGSGSGGGRGGSTSGGHGTPNARGVGLGLPNASSQCP